MRAQKQEIRSELCTRMKNKFVVLQLYQPGGQQSCHLAYSVVVHTILLLFPFSSLWFEAVPFWILLLLNSTCLGFDDVSLIWHEYSGRLSYYLNLSTSSDADTLAGECTISPQHPALQEPQFNLLYYQRASRHSAVKHKWWTATVLLLLSCLLSICGGFLHDSSCFMLRSVGEPAVVMKTGSGHACPEALGSFYLLHMHWPALLCLQIRSSPWKCHRIPSFAVTLTVW